MNPELRAAAKSVHNHLVEWDERLRRELDPEMKPVEYHEPKRVGTLDCGGIPLALYDVGPHVVPIIDSPCPSPDEILELIGRLPEEPHTDGVWVTVEGTDKEQGE